MCEVASVSRVDAVTHTVAIQRVIVQLIVHDMMFDIAHCRCGVLGVVGT